MSIRRIYVEKKQAYQIEGKSLLEDFKRDLNINGLENVRVLHRYDVDGIDERTFNMACNHILAELPVDHIHEGDIEIANDEQVFAMEYLPGQYDQRGDSAIQCIQLLQPEAKPEVQYAKLILIKGKVSSEDLVRIKEYSINPVDSREACLDKKDSLTQTHAEPDAIPYIQQFEKASEEDFLGLKDDLGLAMTVKDLLHTQNYFVKAEGRVPSMTELRVLDTYWSDHCRHTTFLTEIKEVSFDKAESIEPIKKAYELYKDARQRVHVDKEKDMTLMDIALMAMRELRKEGKLDDLEVSDEINACSIKVKAMVDGKEEDWLVMFKNETHNHPTEIEPFGGAATCLGGAIRDPLSGRSYVYQGMRITGSGDPRESIKDTLSGKLPQRKIAKESAHGFSSYGNQIGLATGQVVEIYDEGYKAKHMELGAVIGATPASHVIRENADPGDIIVLLGGQTGRDGCGGATGSSKAHTTQSIEECGAEVQKGNPPVERKIQRLFKRKEVATLIKKCNDFGAGGVAVAVGELADGLIINLDAVPKKYKGLNGTEIAISESQERMAVVLDPKDIDAFMAYAQEENLEATEVAIVTEEKRLIMNWRGDTIVDICREFLDTNGAKQETKIHVTAPKEVKKEEIKVTEDSWLDILKDINVCCQKGLGDTFDSSIGAATVLMPYGGKTQYTPEQVMAAKLPVHDGETTTASLMSYSYDPELAKWSPFHGAYYAVVSSIAKIIAAGGNWRQIRLTFQEFFERLGGKPERWGKPFSSLLGAYYAQRVLDIPAIGGKDSMSGTFHDLDVPPTLVSFGVNVIEASKIKSSDMKEAGNNLVYMPLCTVNEIPEDQVLVQHFDRVNKLVAMDGVKSCRAITGKGLIEALSKMCFGNKVGLTLQDTVTEEALKQPGYGSFVLEIEPNSEADEFVRNEELSLIGTTIKEESFTWRHVNIPLEKALDAYLMPLNKVYPMTATACHEEAKEHMFNASSIYVCKNKISKPKVIIPVFPGTNCEFDTAKAFIKAGADVETLVFKNLTSNDIHASIQALKTSIDQANIIALAGGFSAGDEPDGSGKFITAVFRNPYIKEATMSLLNNRDGLMLGICNGFQALIKLGLVPYGEIVESQAGAPTLSYNTIGRHIATYVETKIVSNQSPWLQEVTVGDVHHIPVSHGEGRFIGDKELIADLMAKGQVATRYVDSNGKVTMDALYNPNGSFEAIEGILSPDGRVFGKMGHSERVGDFVGHNIYGKKDQHLFKSGVNYFK